MEKRYEIKTLRDIFELPTMEAMESCLRETAKMMKQARAVSDTIKASAECLGVEVEGDLEWPESVTWIDDGKGDLDMRIMTEDEEFLRIKTTSKADNH